MAWLCQHPPCLTCVPSCPGAPLHGQPARSACPQARRRAGGAAGKAGRHQFGAQALPCAPWNPWLRHAFLCMLHMLGSQMRCWSEGPSRGRCGQACCTARAAVRTAAKCCHSAALPGHRRTWKRLQWRRPACWSSLWRWAERHIGHSCLLSFRSTDHALFWDPAIGTLRCPPVRQHCAQCIEPLHDSLGSVRRRISSPCSAPSCWTSC